MPAQAALWRIEYRTDLTRSDAPIIPLAYLLEANWKGHARWLGMLFRRRLTLLESEAVDLHTWPELGSLETFMKGFFEGAWAKGPGGSDQIAGGYNHQSALTFTMDKGWDVGVYNDDSFPAVYGSLLGLRTKLTPALTAPVIKMPKPAARPDVEHLAQAA